MEAAFNMMMNVWIAALVGFASFAFLMWAAMAGRRRKPERRERYHPDIYIPATPPRGGRGGTGAVHIRGRRQDSTSHSHTDTGYYGSPVFVGSGGSAPCSTPTGGGSDSGSSADSGSCGGGGDGGGGGE